MTKLKVLFAIMLLLAPLASGQLVYDSVRVKVASGTTCPSGWTASTETITIPARYTVQRSGKSIGGRTLSVLRRAFVDLIWPTCGKQGDERSRRACW